MNWFFKVIYAVLAGCNVIFSLFTPMAISILWILQFPMGTFGNNIILILGILTTIYKAADYFFIKERN
jgi:hypothetical protein